MPRNMNFLFLIILHTLTAVTAQFPSPARIGTRPDVQFGPESGLFGPRGGVGRYRNSAAEYIKEFVTKDGDFVYVKDGNGKKCETKSQTRAQSAIGLDVMKGTAFLAIQAGCKDEHAPKIIGYGDLGFWALPGTPFGAVPGIGKGPSQVTSRVSGFYPSKQAAARGRASFGSCGQSSYKSTCDDGDTRVESLFHMEMIGDYRLAVANGIPNHCYQTDQSYTTSHVACEHFRYIYEKPPKFEGPQSIVYRPTRMGPIGIAVSGAYFYNHGSKEGKCNVAAIQEKETFDSCDGHADVMCRYHYHKAPICIAAWQSCGLMGYMIDGLPVYGQCALTNGKNSIKLKSCYRLKEGASGCLTSHYIFKPGNDCNLDPANGYFFKEDTQTVNKNVTFKAGEYAYFITPEFPFLMPYLAGPGRICKLEF